MPTKWWTARDWTKNQGVNCEMVYPGNTFAGVGGPGCHRKFLFFYFCLFLVIITKIIIPMRICGPVRIMLFINFNEILTIICMPLRRNSLVLLWLWQLAHSRADQSNLTPLSHRFWSFLAWRYPLGRNSEIQNFLALGPLGGVLWAFQNFAIFGYHQPLNGHNFWSTNDRKLVLVSNIMFWDELSEKNF